MNGYGYSGKEANFINYVFHAVNASCMPKGICLDKLECSIQICKVCIECHYACMEYVCQHSTDCPLVHAALPQSALQCVHPHKPCASLSMTSVIVTSSEITGL